MAETKTTQVWGHTITTGRCRDEACGARLWFAEIVATGRLMPFDGEPTALAIATDPPTAREVWTVDLALTHFATCPGAARFRRGRPQ